MIYFEEVQVVPNIGKIFIQWRLNNFSINDNYFFNIFVSQTPEGPWEQINDLPIINNYWIEYPVAYLSKEEYLYFKVDAVCGKYTCSSGPQGLFYNLSKRQFLTVKEIARKNQLSRKINIGIYCKIYKKIVFGPKCNICIDPHTGYCTNSKCATCYGTTKKGGYHTPINAWIEIVEGDRAIIPSELGVIENRLAIAKLGFPIVQKGDIIVEVERNHRWYIEKIVSRESLRSVPVDQTLDIRMISYKDIEYTLGN